MTENDRFLEQIIGGNTLDALNRLMTDQAGTRDELLALNQALYGPATQESLARVTAQEERHQARQEPEDLRARALTLYNLGCFALHQDEILEARMRFSEAVRLDPDNLMARHNLAYAHELMAELDEAKAQYAKVLEQSPDCTLTRLNLAQLKLLEADYEHALEDLHALYRAQPDNMGVLLYLCRGLVLRGSTQDLEEVIDLLDGQPESERYQDLRECRAYAQYLLGDVEEAQAAFQALLDENEGNQFARIGLIRLLASKSDLAGVTEHVERAQALSPSEELGSVLRELRGE